MSPAIKDTGIIQQPLLPELNSPKVIRQASVSGAVFNLSTTIIGAGIMSIPATVKVLGVVPALVLILAVALLADVSAEFLLRFTSAGESATYAGVMKESFGRLGSLGVQICMLICLFCVLVIYLIIIGDVLSGNGSAHMGVLQEWFGIHWWNSRAYALLFIVVFILLPLVQLERIESLRFSSAVSILMAVVFVAICSVLAISAVIEGKTKHLKLLPDLDSRASFFDLFTAVPVIVTAFTFHFNVFPIGFEVGKPSDMKSAVRISVVLCAAIYFSTGLFGYLLFGDSIMSDILINFDHISGSASGSLLNDSVRISYALHLILAFPILNYSLRASIDELVFSKRNLLATDRTRLVLLTCFLLALIYLGAIAIPDIWYFFQFVGSTTTVCLAFIFPGALVLRDLNGVFTKKDRIIASTMVILAVVTSAIAISTNIKTLLGSKL